MTRSPDPGRSHAALLGVSRYCNLPDIPAVENNLKDLHRLLATPFGGMFDADHCEPVHNPSDNDTFGTAVHAASSSATDVLLVYYAGHGVLDERGDLHLALPGTDPNRVGWTAVPFQTLHKEIRMCAAPLKILILDCCFSGRAFGVTMSAPSSAVLGQVGINGTYTIVSSGANVVSLAPPGHRNTAFTAALIAQAVADPHRSLDQLYPDIVRHLIDNGHPAPHRRQIDTAGDLVLFGPNASVLRDPQRLRATVTSIIGIPASNPAATAGFRRVWGGFASTTTARSGLSSNHAIRVARSRLS